MRKDICIILTFLIITDLSIIMNIPLLRQFLPFLFFNIVPGYIFLKIIPVNLKKVEEFIMSISISVAILMLIGLLLNSCYPFINAPISLFPIIVTLNLFILILIFVFYIKGDLLDFTSQFNEIKFNEINYLSIFSFFLPLLTILGSYLMNTYSNNWLLLITLISIPFYVIFLIRKNASESAYIYALFNISLTLLLMNSLPSNYLIGRDIHWEYYELKQVLTNQRWIIGSSLRGAYNACLSITLLPSIYKLLLDVPSVFIFKVYYAFFGAVLPLCVYVTSKNVLSDEKLSFLACLAFIFQLYFVFLLGCCRQVLALLFFSSAVLVFTLYIEKIYKRILFIFFLFAMILSHYATSYIFFIMLFVIPLISHGSQNLTRRLKFLRVNDKDESPLNDGFFGLSIAVLFFIMLFLWYAQVTSSPFQDFVRFINETFVNMANFFAADLRSPEVASVWGGEGFANVPNTISILVHDAFFAFIILGSIDLFILGSIDLNGKSKVSINLKREYKFLILVSFFILASFILLPFVSTGYGGGRLFVQLLVILAPLFVIGIKRGTMIFSQIFLKKDKNPQFSLCVIGIFLIILFSCVTYLNYYFAGIPYSYSLDSVGEKRYESFIYDSEVKGSQWLNYHRENGLKIYSDAFGYSRMIAGFEHYPNLDRYYFKKNKSLKKGYIYLRHANVKIGLVFIDSPVKPIVVHNGTFIMDNVRPLIRYSSILKGKNRIYDAGNVVILFES